MERLQQRLDSAYLHEGTYTKLCNLIDETIIYDLTKWIYIPIYNKQQAAIKLNMLHGIKTKNYKH